MKEKFKKTKKWLDLKESKRESLIRGSRQCPLSKYGKVLQVLLCCYVWTPNYSPVPPAGQRRLSGRSLP